VLVPVIERVVVQPDRVESVEKAADGRQRVTGRKRAESQYLT
jgi:hypothetical protein